MIMLLLDAHVLKLQTLLVQTVLNCWWQEPPFEF